MSLSGHTGLGNRSGSSAAGRALAELAEAVVLALVERKPGRQRDSSPGGRSFDVRAGDLAGAGGGGGLLFSATPFFSPFCRMSRTCGSRACQPPPPTRTPPTRRSSKGKRKGASSPGRSGGPAAHAGEEPEAQALKLEFRKQRDALAAVAGHLSRRCRGTSRGRRSWGGPSRNPRPRFECR